MVVSLLVIAKVEPHILLALCLENYECYKLLHPPAVGFAMTKYRNRRYKISNLKLLRVFAIEAANFDYTF
jgi:hypothetical protein